MNRAIAEIIQKFRKILILNASIQGRVQNLIGEFFLQSLILKSYRFQMAYKC
jgi:hypothetical protein